MNNLNVFTLHTERDLTDDEHAKVLDFFIELLGKDFELLGSRPIPRKSQDDFWKKYNSVKYGYD